LKDPQPLLYHNEPIWLGDDLVGFITSGAYGHSLGGCIGLGHVPADSVEGDFEIEVAGVRYPADASLRPMYDPKNDRIRS
jgi:glycine cleavage system aminomethyltransferase T